MNKSIVVYILLTFILLITPEAKADLIDRGNGLIYDDSLNITWLQNADSEGSMTWSEANEWAGSFFFQGYSDWRLPTTDPLCPDKNCTDNEMGHLFYTDGIKDVTMGMFSDVKSSIYWSSTEYDNSTAWRFNFKYGSQGTSDKEQTRYAWAVRDGDSTPPVAPEPLSYLLFISGGITILSRFYLKQSS